MKKLLSVFLVAVMLFVQLPFTAFSEEAVSAEEQENNTVVQDSSDEGKTTALWEYEPYGEGVVLTGYNGTAIDVYIPATVEDENGNKLNVLKIGDSLFENNDALNSATLGEGILEIGTAAFKDADNLVCIVTNQSLTIIGAEAFFSCDNFNSIIIYDTVTTIGKNAFGECPKLTIWCNEGNAGYGYAVENNIPYELMNGSVSPLTVEKDGLTYYISNGEAAVTACDKTLTDIVVPNTINGVPVTKINQAFFNCKKLVSVILPETLRTITQYSFQMCEALVSIVVPDSVTTIGTGAFANCVSLTSAVLPVGLKTIPGWLFDSCFHLKTVKMPLSFTSVGAYAFANTAITEIVLPEALTTIEEYAFVFTDISSIIFPKNIKKIGNYAFSGTWLKNIIVDGENLVLGKFAFGYCSLLTDVVLTGNVTTIGEKAFYDCNALVNVVLNEGIASIGSCAFDMCEKIEVLKLPKSISSCYADSFYWQTILGVVSNSYSHSVCEENTLLYFLSDVTEEPQLITFGSFKYFINSNNEAIAVKYSNYSSTSVTVPEKVSDYPVIGIYGTFYNCNKITTISLPSSLTKIGPYTFYNCGITKLSVPDSVNYIGKHAFESSKLENIILPRGITSIKESTFSFCENLVTLSIPDTVIEIGKNTFYNCKSLAEIELPVKLKYIREYLFYNCTSLTDITIPDEVFSIETLAFAGCTALENVSISSNSELWSVREYAFLDCISLKSMVLPNKTWYVFEGAFQGCTILSTVILSNELEQIRKKAFYGCTALEDIDIPQSVNLIEANAFQNTGIKTVYLSENVTSLSTTSFPATAMLVVYENSYAHTFAKNNNLLYYIYDGSEIPSLEFCVENDIEYCLIDDKAIVVSYSGNATEVTIPQQVNGFNVTELLNAFEENTSVISVSLPDGLQKIGNNAFKGCSALVNVNIPNTVTNIGENAFYRAGISSIVIPDSVTSLGNYVFQSTKLVSITIPGSISIIPNQAFGQIATLKEVVLGEGVEEISSNAFFSCVNLEKVIIPETVDFIGYYAFYDCVKLKTLYIPKNTSYLIPSYNASSIIYLVYEDTYAYNKVKSNYLHFVLRETENPEISYGTGISGTATYSDSSVAAGATVEILYDDGAVKETVKTDENGAYEFTYAEVGEYTIRITDANGNTASERINVMRKNAFDVFLSGDTNLVLKKGWSVSGTVSEVPATVTLTDVDSNVIASVTTDENGNFTLNNVPNGTYIIKAETENGTTAIEITVFDGDISDITIDIKVNQTVNIYGYVEVEDREFNHHRRNWVDVTLYNSEGIAVDKYKSDADGKYTFTNLPIGEYTIVAETHEMRPDNENNYDRSYTLTGYAYISALETGNYEVETIILYEENDYLATISGKVTAHGETQNCEIVLSNVFRCEVAQCTTGMNGKYSFKNVRDGLYFITATTQSDGMGFAIVVVKNGTVYGDTDITVYKSDKIKALEDSFENDVPDCNSREDAIKYIDRIAEGKRLYDGLSEKEKKQLSKAYVERLNKYCEWIAECNYTADDGVTVENGGLVISGDELENEQTVEFKLNVTKTEAFAKSEDGVKNDNDFIQHSMEDAAGKSEIMQYYEITMTKTVDGVEKVISNVTKYTDTTGKFRITMPIPEEYRGYKNYSVLHVHNGETVTLVDLDDNPNTVTFEVDKFSTFALTATNEELGEAVADELEAVAGDIDYDGKTNLNDLITLAQYVAGWEDLTVDVRTLDTNGDNIVDLNDVTNLARYLAGWEGITLAVAQSSGDVDIDVTE